MPGTIIQLNEGVIKQELKELVRTSVEETLRYRQRGTPPRANPAHRTAAVVRRLHS